MFDADRYTSDYTRGYGKGTVRVVPATAGKAYLDGAKTVQASLAQAVLYPTDTRRTLITDFARQTGANMPATTSQNQVLAYPLWSQKGGVILLANYTGEPVPALTVDFEAPVGFKTIRSLKRGPLTFTRLASGRIQLSVPLGDVTDVLVVE